ncbi:MAG: pyridoxal-phosphate dependent enzyme [Nitrospirota bacterium]
MSVLDCIGNTPLVKLSNINPNHKVSLLTKLEGNNPGGSVKDRIAYYIIIRSRMQRRQAGSRMALSYLRQHQGIQVLVLRW